MALRSRLGVALLGTTAAGVIAVRRTDALGNESSRGTSFAQRADFPLSVPLLAWSLRAAADCKAAAYHEPREARCDECRLCDCGEDAYFMAAPTPSTVSIGIADGVGGWRSRGGDPAAFAWELMSGCRIAAESEPQGTVVRRRSRVRALLSRLLRRADRLAADPRSLLDSGFRRMRQSAFGPPTGGCTACLASLNRTSGVLSIANLGDSGALVLRGAQVILESRPQQIDFNYPYQLSVNPDGRIGEITPERADVYTTPVQEGDLVILMTDGVLDNLATRYIRKAAELLWDNEPQEIAQGIVNLAYALSMSEAESPFSVAARAAGFHYPPHGKEDDITVVVARVEGASANRDGEEGQKECGKSGRKKKKKKATAGERSDKAIARRRMDELQRRIVR